MCKTMTYAGVEALLLWASLSLGQESVLGEPYVEDYDGLLERMEAQELLLLLEKVKARLKELEAGGAQMLESKLTSQEQVPAHLYIDKTYTIRTAAPGGPIIPLRPLVKALFILFLKHPEGILLKQRDLYAKELESIYGIIAPGVSRETVNIRVRRLMNMEDNSFSENLSALNTSLEKILPQSMVDNYKVKGYNGHPRRIPLQPLYVHWE